MGREGDRNGQTDRDSLKYRKSNTERERQTDRQREKEVKRSGKKVSMRERERERSKQWRAGKKTVTAKANNTKSSSTEEV